MFHAAADVYILYKPSNVVLSFLLLLSGPAYMTFSTKQVSDDFHLLSDFSFSLFVFLSICLSNTSSHSHCPWTHSLPLTEHKSVLSLAALCSASVIMHGRCCYSSMQGPSDMPRPVCFMPHPGRQPPPQRRRPCLALAPLFPKYNHNF